MRRIADAEVRLFHLYVHEPLIRDAVPELEMAEEMGELAADILPLAAPLTEYLHERYLRFFVEQDVVGHMEADSAMDTAEIELGHVNVTLCFIDLTGFTRYTEEEGDIEALDVVENFVAARRSDAAAGGDDREDDRRRGDGRLARPRLADRVGGRPSSPASRSGRSRGSGSTTATPSTATATTSAARSTSSTASSTGRWPARCWSPTRSAARSPAAERLEFEPIGEVSLKGFPEPTELFVVRAA